MLKFPPSLENIYNTTSTTSYVTLSYTNQADILIDSFTNFFNKLLWQDKNYTLYLKEWIIFKEIVKNNPLSKDTHEKYINNLDFHKSFNFSFSHTNLYLFR